MEIIRKTINLEELRNRRVGTIPSIPFDNVSEKTENGNYGNFVYDFQIGNKKVKYLDILSKYNFIQEQLRNGVYLERKNDKYSIIERVNKLVDCEIVCDYNFCKYDFTICDGSLYYYKTDGYYEGEFKGEKIVLVDNFDKINEINNWWSDLTGSKKFCEDFEKIAFSNNECGEGTSFQFSTITPTIDLNILLTNDTVNEDIFYPYEYSLSADGKTIYAVSGENENQQKYVSNLTNINVESKLQSLISPRAEYLDNGVIGIFEEDGKFYKYEGGRWGETSNSNLYCADGEEINPGERKYRNIPVKECVKFFINENDDGVYYFRVLYKSYLNLPYNKGEILNTDTYFNSKGEVVKKVGDVIEEIDKDGDICTIQYRLGCDINGNEWVKDTGILYKESYNYSNSKKEIIIDEIYPVEIDCEILDYESSKTFFYDDNLKVNRWINTAEIIGMERGLPEVTINEWKLSAVTNLNVEEEIVTISEHTRKNLLITKESSNGLQEEPKYDLNIMFNRGAAAAWEKHFKLSECNTMEDLENYGNNFFNL